MLGSPSGIEGWKFFGGEMTVTLVWNNFKQRMTNLNDEQ